MTPLHALQKITWMICDIKASCEKNSTVFVSQIVIEFLYSCERLSEFMCFREQQLQLFEKLTLSKCAPAAL